MSVLLEGLRLMMIGGDKGHLQTLWESQRKGISKGNSLFALDSINSFDERLIDIRTEFKRKRR